MCYGTRKIVKNILVFFVKYRYYVSKVNIQGNIDENNEDRRKEAMTGDSRGFFFKLGAMRMAILLRQLCEKASYLYGMRILAGENGTGNIVQWIHTLEDVETGGFIHGGALIFTTGIAQKGNEWLLEFVENLYEREARINSNRLCRLLKSLPRIFLILFN